MRQSIITAFRIAYIIDKKSIPFCVVYNLVKQLMNVFYGVYFIRMLLEALETHRSMYYILGVLFLMLSLNVVFGWVNQYYSNIYMPDFELRVEGYVNEHIAETAATIPYDEYCSSAELDRYNRVLNNSTKMIMKTFRSFGLVCGLLEAFAMILYYIVSVDLFAILLSLFPLLYSYFLAKKKEISKYEFNKKEEYFERRKRYSKRVFYLRDYAKEIRTSKISCVIKDIYRDNVEKKKESIRRDAQKIAQYSFWEVFLGDAASVVVPVIYVLIRMVYGKSYYLGDFIGITQAITTFAYDVEWMLDEVTEIKSASLYVNDYVDYILRKKNTLRKRRLHKDEEFTLVFEQVKYQYPGSDKGNYALNGVDITIQKGEKIAIVGENGAGKTTFVSLMMNLISCGEGQIRLNGISIDEYSREDLKDFYGVVLQDYHIYPVTIRENLSINGKLTESGITDAIRQMELSNKILDIDVPIGKEIDNKGIELSGGEYQKLALARVIANHFPFVILDEPTSAMDALSERKMNQLVMKALEDYGSTLVLVSHKMSTTKLVDRILVFNEGRIIEDGSHEQLMSLKGAYYAMYQEQMNMYKGLE